MKNILNGTFNVDDTLNKLKLGNLMKYEYCTGNDTTCMIDHGDHTVGWYKENGNVWEYIGQEVYCDGGEKFCGIEGHEHTVKGWYHKKANGTWLINTDGKNMGNNILLCMIDRSVNDFRQGDFTQKLIDKINEYVLIGDIYDMTSGDTTTMVSGPIKLISPNTKIGDISGEMEKVMKNATAGELKDNGLLPVSVGTADRMSGVYGAVVRYEYDDSTGTWSTDAIVVKSNTETQARAALDKHVKPEVGEADYVNKYAEYVKALGETYWKSLTIDQLVDVLLYSTKDNL